MKKNAIIFIVTLIQTFSFGQTKHKLVYDNGNIKETGEFNKNGERTGEWISYFEKGNVSSKGKFDNGKPEGEFSAYYENGNLKEVGKFTENGSKIGEWKEYHENGKINNIGN